MEEVKTPVYLSSSIQEDLVIWGDEKRQITGHTSLDLSVIHDDGDDVKGIPCNKYDIFGKCRVESRPGHRPSSAPDVAKIGV
jgi:hypothetical protein